MDAVTADQNTLCRVVSVMIECNIPVLLWGLPGIGKSAVAQSLGTALERHTEVVIASVRDPSDFAGLPIVVDGDVHFAPPAWAKRLKKSPRGLLFLDEISQAPPAVQGAVMRVVLDREVGDLTLGDHVSIIAAANDATIAADGWDLAPPLANRFCHLDWKADAGVFVRGMIEGWPTVAGVQLPHNWADRIPNNAARIASFIRSRPSLLHTMPGQAVLRDEEHRTSAHDHGTDTAEAGRAWASPRTWEWAGIALAAFESIGLTIKTDEVAIMLEGLLGAAGIEFLTWAHNMDLPDPETALADPKGVDLSKVRRGDQIGALLDSVAAAALREHKDITQRYMACWTLIERLASEGHTDLAIPAATLLGAARARIPGAPIPQQARALRPILERAGMVAPRAV